MKKAQHSDRSSFTVQELFGGSPNPFLHSSEPMPGFSFVCPGIDIWTFPKELCLSQRRESRHGAERRIHTVWNHAKTGLECEVTYSFFADTGTLEYGGTLTNNGSAPLPQVRGPFPLALSADVQATGAPRLMTLSGGGPTDAAYPTPTFAPRFFDIAGALTLQAGPGGMSTLQNMPFIVVTNADESFGYAAALEWPCFWMIYCGDRWENGRRLAYALLHVDQTCFTLKPGESVPLPRVVLTFFEGNHVSGSNHFRRHLVRHVVPKLRGADALPPVFYNHWFGCGNHFSSAMLKPIVDRSAELGIEDFVIDTGWFEGGFRAGCGNWEKQDRQKLPEGLEGFARYVEAKGMRFGTWRELEYAEQGTDWAIRHPDWFRDCRTQSDRLLRLEDRAVREGVLEFLERFVPDNRLQWLRWDFNSRPAPFWAERETPGEGGRLQLGYGAGLYALLDEVLRRFPNLHLEACAGGGHRMDVGTLRRAHSCWMSDDSSHIPALRSRLRGMNRYLPGAYGNTCLCQMQWGDDPGDSQKRPLACYESGYPLDDLRSRMAGGLGFAENFTRWNAATMAQVRREIERYKSVRRYLMQDYYPILEPTRLRDWDGWQFHDPEDGSGFLMAFRSESARATQAVVPGGLDRGITYRFENVDTGATHTLRGGQELPLQVERKEANTWFRYQVV